LFWVLSKLFWIYLWVLPSTITCSKHLEFVLVLVTILFIIFSLRNYNGYQKQMLVGSWKIGHIKGKLDHVPEKTPVFHKLWFHWQALCRSRFKKYLRGTNTRKNKAIQQLIAGPTLMSLLPECPGNDNLNAKIIV